MTGISTDDVFSPSLGTKLLQKRGIKYFLLINPNLFSCVRINQTAREIFELCNGTNSLEDISKILSNKYGIDLERLRKDVVQTTELLYSYGLLVRPNDPNPIPQDMFRVGNLEEVWINVTNKCNLHCLTCFKNAGTKYPRELTVEEIESLVKEISSNFHHPTIIISGGEPTLREDLIHILKVIKDNMLKVHLITNGTLLTRSMISEWKSIGVDFVQVSLDGSKPEVNDVIRGEGIFQQVVNNVKLLKEFDLRFSLYPTICKLNLEDVPNMIKLFSEITGRSRFSAAFFAPVGRGSINEGDLAVSSDDYIELFKRIIKDKRLSPMMRNLEGFESQIDRVPPNLTRKLNCGLGTATISIDADGSVYPCHWLHLPQYKAGNIRERRFSELYFKSEVLQRLRGIRVDKLENCAECEIRYLCGGGCRALALIKNGSLEARFPYCDFFKFYFDHALWGVWDL
ncbi:MAG: PqqD family peptide modification chaperone [Thermoproteota archaeon]